MLSTRNPSESEYSCRDSQERAGKYRRLSLGLPVSEMRHSTKLYFQSFCLAVLVGAGLLPAKTLFRVASVRHPEKNFQGGGQTPFQGGGQTQELILSGLFRQSLFSSYFGS